MGLYSAMTTSVTGMAAQANLLAAVSENISNSSTTGYKQATTEFDDLLSQVSTNDYTAGGVSTSTRYQVTEQGDLTSTTSSTDLAINGNGFFLVNDASGATYLTRAGSFTEQNGNLVNSAGYTLMGYSLQPNSNGVTNSMSGLVPINLNAATLAATPSTTATLAANLPSTDAVVTGTPSATNYSEKTSIVGYDNLGTSVTMDVYLSNVSTTASPNTWQLNVYNSSTGASMGTSTLNFDSSTGALSSPSSPVTLTMPSGNTVAMDVSGLTQLASSFSITNATANGNAASALSSVSVAKDGTVSFVYASGTEVSAYKIPLGNVESPENLTSLSGDVFQQSASSGQITIGAANEGGMGTINSSELESSTVDLATQLTDMIQAQRGYEANSKVFQTGSDLLSELFDILK